MLSPAEMAVLDHAAQAPMLSQALAWATVNSGSRNLDGLSTMAGLLADAFARLPGAVSLIDPAPVELVSADGQIATAAHGRHLLVSVRPKASRRILLTGHMDTVFGADHSFQSCRWIDDATLNGPGVADMKGGIALMLAALAAFESWDGAATLGYDVVINSDEEVGRDRKSVV